jgi:carboxypeptidase family protein/type IX secretion system substrate protein
MELIMKTSKNSLLSLVLCFSFLLISGSALYADNSISGTVRYSDNNEIVTDGIVKAYTTTGSLVGSASIHADGSYLITGLPTIQVDLLGLPNVEPEDNFVPTCFPNQVNPLFAQSIFASGTITHRDISVVRLEGGHSPFANSRIYGDLLLSGEPLEDVVVYLQNEGQYRYFAVSSSDGSFSLEGIPEGDYILGIHRIGFTSVTSEIHVKSNEERKVNFEVSAAEQKELQTNNVTAQNFVLNQNYPNPFNPSTVISYNIPVPGSVNLSVYNSAGQLVKELVNQFQNSGTYNVMFASTSVSSGIYFYKLEANGYVQTKRMTLVK